MTETQQQQATTYVVLRNVSDGWNEVSRVDARSRNEAVRNGTKQGREQMEGNFKAVPARSWDFGVRIKTRTVSIADIEEVEDGATSRNGAAAPSAPARQTQAE